MAKKKLSEEEPEKDRTERWLLTYADMITLLMLFFIVLYSISSVSQQQFGEVSVAIEQAFSGGNLGIFEGLSSGASGILERGSVKVFAYEKLTREAFIKKSETLLKDMINGNQVSVGLYADGVKITLFADFFFKSASANLSYEAAPALTRISDMLLGINNDLRIEGNTDNTANYGDDQTDFNWNLSSDRGLNVLKYLQMMGVDGKRMIAVANGSNRPARPNSTPEGRAYNRRVDIIILF